MLKPLLATVIVVAGAMPALAAPRQPTPEELYQRMCGNVLNLLPHTVRPDAVLAVPNDAHVVLHRICTGVDLNSFGNAAGLGSYIARNRALSRALASHGYGVDNVVGIEIDGTTVQLYVHRR